MEEILLQIRRRRPVVYNIANIVTADFCADALLAVGASPVMGLEPSEGEELVSISDSVVLNIGTATVQSGELMEQVAKYASDKGKPVILDPVGAGASRFRTDLSVRIIEACHPIIRCNYSEFLALAGIRSETRGVDSAQNDFFDTGTISALATALGTTLAVTGRTDVITDGRQTVLIHNGSGLMESISGTGCVCSALAGAAAAVAQDDTVTAIAAAVALNGICGEKAAENFTGTASMKNAFTDCLSTISEGEFKSRLKTGILL